MKLFYGKKMLPMVNLSTDISVRFCSSGSTNSVQLITLVYKECMKMSALNHLPNILLFSVPVKTFFILSHGNALLLF